MQDCADWSKPATRVVIDCGGTVARSPYRSFLACGAAVLLAGLVYLNSLHNPFVYDDSRSILDNRSLTDPSVAGVLLQNVARPLVNVSYLKGHMSAWSRAKLPQERG